jgi:hypothetical protein
MIYHYEVKDYGVHEIPTGKEKKFLIWNFKILMDKNYFQLSFQDNSNVSNSLNRTRKWLIENHPELLI